MALFFGKGVLYSGRKPKLIFELNNLRGTISNFETCIVRFYYLRKKNFACSTSPLIFVATKCSLFLSIYTHFVHIYFFFFLRVQQPSMNERTNFLHLQSTFLHSINSPFFFYFYEVINTDCGYRFY